MKVIGDPDLDLDGVRLSGLRGVNSLVNSMVLSTVEAVGNSEFNEADTISFFRFNDP